MRAGSRLRRLERCWPPGRVSHLYLAFVDGDGRVPDDGTPEARPWVGRHYAGLPAPTHVIAGVDPRAVFGLATGAGA